MTEIAPQETVLLRASGISKRFGITQALDDVSVSFRAGEVHAVMGENGAGKSTLGKAIAGLHRQDSGVVTIAVPGGGTRDLKPGSIADAFGAGIRIVHQELAQCPNLTVAENLCLHDLPTRMLGFVDRRAMNERAARLLSSLDPSIDIQAPLGALSPGRRQICQIASALDESTSVTGGHGARLIVLDEPTSSLSVSEADRLLDITRSLAKRGLTIVYVSHRMGEIFQVCDRVTVLRDGKFVATNDVKSIDEPTLVEQMIGRRIEGMARRGGASAAIKLLAGDTSEHHVGAKPRLSVQRLSSPGKLHEISLEVRPGEVLGIGGLVGAGRSELFDAIFGLDPRATGTVSIDGQPIDLHGAGRANGAISRGIGYVPEDRRLQGLFLQLGIGENITLPYLSRLARLFGLRNVGAEKSVVSEKMKRFKVKAASDRSLPGELSGGNQQKLLIARWMGRSTRVLLLDEPTRGIDVGTKSEVHRLVRAAAEGVDGNDPIAVLLVSSEMPELLALSDRILVMCSGRLTGELTGDAMTQANILRLATIDSSVAARAG